MNAIDRGVMVIHLRQPFLDWINRTVEMSSPVTMKELEEDCSVFLVPEQDRLEDMLEYIRPLKPRLFEMELESWNRDPSTWPQERTEELFDAWCELRAHSKVRDLVDGPIVKEPGELLTDLAGTWVVISGPDFDDEYLSMETTPCVVLDQEDHEITGDFHIGLISGSLSGVIEGDRVRFSFDGMDEMDPANGAGTITIQGETMTFTLEFHYGDVFTFDCVREGQDRVAR